MMKTNPQTPSTVALSMIVKDEVDQVLALAEQAAPFFDEMNFVVSDKEAFKKIRFELELNDKVRKDPRFVKVKVRVKQRDWNDRFDEARNVAMNMCKTTYFFWVDADDSFDFRAIPQLVDIADENGIDAIFMPYNYMQDEVGNCITRHWRERLVRLGKGYEWRGWVHETCITDEPKKEHKVNFEVRHNLVAGAQEEKNSYARNHVILEKAYAETKDPRYLHYLGMSYFTAKDYNKAAELLSEYLKVGGSIEDVYRTLGLLSECAYHLNNFELALEYATKCATLKPEYPMAYWLLAQYEADQDNYEEALEWVKVSETKPDPDTLSVWDPSSRGRATMIAARCLFMLQRYNEALVQIRKIENLPEVQDILEDFYHEADLETFIFSLPKMRQFFHDDESLYEALTDELRYDTRLQPLRYKVKKPRDWLDNSLVIFCGQGYEEWGPQTLGKGMGGSEEAVVYLSRELAKLGWNVTVYGEVEHTLYDNLWHKDEPIKGTVVYEPWKKIDVRDNFNVFVSWRAPQYLERIKAKVKLADIHDVLPESLMKDYPDVTYLVKSAYHRSLTPKLPDDKFRIIGNGIAPEQFK